MKLASALLAVGLALGVSASCLERYHDERVSEDVTRCASCHGDPERPGDRLLRAAPPKDLWQKSAPQSPGVGAHLIHLQDGENHRAIPCNECHLVPERTDSPGHADDARPAELLFGPVASSGDRSPSYDAASRRCSDSWCHGAGEADAVWNEPRDSAGACGSCHGLPPPLPHPQSSECFVCHGDVMDESGSIIDRGRHVDGRVDVDEAACSLCHGTDQSAAPPPDTRGNTDRAAVGVGAHQAHLTGGNGRPLACSECHSVPSGASPTHPEGGHAVVSLVGVAATGSRSPEWDRESLSCGDTWCHGPGAPPETASPSWTLAASLGCSSCHGMPPSLPHPQSDQCVACHGDIVNGAQSIIAKRRHVDGIVDVEVTQSCTACHGSIGSAPPVDLAGNSDVAAPGVGAHQVHLLGTDTARAVPCKECHRVPSEVLAPGHLDSALPAELRFSGVANTGDIEPVYDGKSCNSGYCHGAVFPDGHGLGGLAPEPAWTLQSLPGAPCESCHGMPPPRPHVSIANCSSCHHTVFSDNRTFRHPELHVNGVVEFGLP